MKSCFKEQRYKINASNSQPPRGSGQPETESPHQAVTCLANHHIDSCPRASRRRNDMGWLGAVKSIEITTESGTSTGAVTAVDSTYIGQSSSMEVRQNQKASEARQDNGTVWIVSVVAGVVLPLALLIIKKLFHK